jgi:hypothetical protein
VHKPPTLLVHDEVESVEFCRQGGGVLAASAKTFDLAIRMRTDQARAAISLQFISCSRSIFCRDFFPLFVPGFCLPSSMATCVGGAQPLTHFALCTSCCAYLLNLHQHLLQGCCF